MALFLVISQYWKFTQKSEMCQVSVFLLCGTSGNANNLKTYTDKARLQNISGLADFNAWEPAIHFFILFSRCALLFGKFKELCVLYAHTFTCSMSRWREESFLFCENIKKCKLISVPLQCNWQSWLKFKQNGEDLIPCMLQLFIHW